jgi:hypothetical protein
MKNFYSYKVKNTVAVVLAVLTVVIAIAALTMAADALFFTKVYTQASLAWALNMLSIPTAVAALWLVDHKDKTRIIGDAFCFGGVEHLLIDLIIFATALKTGYIIRGMIWAGIAGFVLFTMLVLCRYWVVTRRINEGTYKEDDEAELREQEMALRAMLS